MRKQQEIWRSEHAQMTALPTMALTEPTAGVKDLVAYLKGHNIPLAGRGIDIGSGKGRNTMFLAEQGVQMDGIEYIDLAIAAATALTESRGLSKRVTYHLAAMDEPWPFADNTFDFAIDSFSSIDIETLAGRIACRNEMLRTLKPGGHAFINVVSVEDEWEKEILAKHPGDEPNSAIWPGTNKFQKDYDEPELRSFYADFEIIELDKRTKPAYKLGRSGKATNYWLLARKPN